MNASLLTAILEHEQQHSGESKTNVGGWHFETGRLELCGDAGMGLKRHIYEVTDEVTRRVLAENNHPWRPMRWTLHAWADVN